MFFNVAQLLKEPTGATRTHKLVEEIDELDEDLEPLSPLVGTLQMLRTHSGILVRGELSLGLRIECNRCLGPVVMPVRFTLEESFRPLTEVRTGRYIHPDEFEGEEDNLEDEALLINEQHILDISEVVRQNIWIELPLYPTCTDAGLDECQGKEDSLLGINPQFEPADGDNLVQATGEGQSITESIDPRWSALLDLQIDTTDPTIQRNN
ncbi:MAG: DUF177 domain-containing protein [Chloroflexota bacterium]